MFLKYFKFGCDEPAAGQALQSRTLSKLASYFTALVASLILLPNIASAQVVSLGPPIIINLDPAVAKALSQPDPYPSISISADSGVYVGNAANIKCSASIFYSGGPWTCQWHWSDSYADSQGLSVTRTFSYATTVTLYVRACSLDTNTCGAWDSLWITALDKPTVPVDTGPQAIGGLGGLHYNGTEASETSGATIDFGTNGEIPDYYKAHYDWDFGDGVHSFDRKTSHTYGKIPCSAPCAVVYSGSINVTDSANKTIATGIISVTINSAPIQNKTPIAKISGGTSFTMIAGTSITLNGSASYDPDGSISIYSWRFGDGTDASGVCTFKTLGTSSCKGSDNVPVITHTYTQPGVYPVTLIVTDNSSSVSSQAQVWVTVLPIGAAIVPALFLN